MSVNNTTPSVQRLCYSWECLFESGSHASFSVWGETATKLAIYKFTIWTRNEKLAVKLDGTFVSTGAIVRNPWLKPGKKIFRVNGFIQRRGKLVNPWFSDALFTRLYGLIIAWWCVGRRTFNNQSIVNIKAIFTIINTTWAVVKIGLEKKFRLLRDLNPWPTVVDSKADIVTWKVWCR